MAIVSINYLLEAGVHFGHQKRRWNPKMKKYIFNSRDDIYIIDLQKVSEALEKAYAVVKSVAEKDGKIFSNPRTYRVVKPEIMFKGVIRFQNPFFRGSKEELAKIKEELKEAIMEFNSGFYGIGNSKSRGYGQIEVEIVK